jgi:hypothetical protein
MGAVTGIPLAVGLQLLIEGHINAAGVHAPEAAVDARLFFSALAEQCAGVEADDAIVTITRRGILGMRARATRKQPIALVP